MIDKKWNEEYFISNGRDLQNRSNKYDHIQMNDVYS
jgi:hypothetical protein